MFLVCGEALFDLFVTAETPDGVSLDARLGGSPFNVAVGLARLERPVALLAGLSRDRLGRRLRTAVTEAGVSPDWLVEKAAPTTLSLVDVAPDGGPAYAFYGSGAADRVLVPDDLPALDDRVSGLHFGSYSLVADPTGATLLSLARQAADGRRLITLDLNVRLTVEPDGDLWRQRVAQFSAAASLVKVSREDIDHLYPGIAPERLAGNWLDGGARLVVVTDGAAGASAFRRSGSLRVDAPAVQVVDTVGAGDTFQAAMIAALQELNAATPPALDALGDDALVRVLSFAVRAAAVTCGRRGADLPHRGDLPALSHQVT